MSIDVEEAGPSGQRQASTSATSDARDHAAAWIYTPVYTLQGHTKSVSALAIAPDGRELASAGADGLLKIWSVATGSLLATLDYTAIDENGKEDEGDSALFDSKLPNGPSRSKGANAKHKDGPLRLKARLRGLNDVAWSRDGHYLVCGGDDKIVRVWDAKRRKLVRQLKGHTSFVFCVTFSPDGTLVISGGFDETVRIWDLPRGTCHRTIAAHSEAVTSVNCNRDGSVLASSSYDGLIRLWDAPTGQCLKTLVHGEAQPIGHVTFSPNGFQLLATSLDGTIRLWDMANARVLKTYSGHQNAKFALKATFTAWKSQNANGDASSSPPCMVVAGSEDHRVYLWDLQTKAVKQTLFGHRDVVLTVATHERLPIIASASLDRDPCIKIWRATQPHHSAAISASSVHHCNGSNQA